MVRRSARRVGRFFTSHKEFFIAWAIVIVVVAGVYLLWPSGSSPVPANITKQINFKVVYPSKTNEIQSSSWKYESSTQTASFEIKMSGVAAIVSEQEVPLQYRTDEAAYDRFIGSLRPYANFNVPLGSVTLANFVTAGDYDPTGLAGILKTHNTLIIIHPDANKELTQNQWQNLFQNLKVTD